MLSKVKGQCVHVLGKFWRVKQRSNALTVSTVSTVIFMTEETVLLIGRFNLTNGLPKDAISINGQGICALGKFWRVQQRSTTLAISTVSSVIFMTEGTVLIDGTVQPHQGLAKEAIISTCYIAT